MKKSQLNRVNAIFNSLGSYANELSLLKDSLQDQFDEKTEKWQDSPSGEKLLSEIDILDCLVISLEDIAFTDMEDL